MISFSRDGISLKVPHDWRVEEESAEEGWAVTFFSPDTAFVLISLRPDAVSPVELVDQTLEALRGEYTQLDVESVVESIGGQPAIGHDIDFFAIDTPISCYTRAIDSPSGPVLVLAQMSDLDQEQHEASLWDIIESIRVDDE